jgi:hypothetical protein
MRRFVPHLLVATCAVLIVGCSSSDEAGDPAAFCDQITAIGDLDRSLTGDPEVLRMASEQLDDLAASAGVEVRRSVEVISDALGTMAKAADETLASGGDETAALEAAVRALEPDLALVEQSTADLEAYTLATCGTSPGVTATDG